MASIPSARRSGLDAGGRPRPRRGAIVSYGEGRTCATPACETQLSMYNQDELCWTHAAELEASRRAARA